MIERRVGHCAVVTPDGDSQSTRLDDLNRIVQSDQVIWRARFALIRSGITFVLVRKTHNFDIAQPKLSNQTFEHPQSVWPLNRIVIEMRVSRQNDVDWYRRKLGQEPLWINSGWIIPPRIRQNGQACGRCDLEGIVPIELDPDIAQTRRVSTVLLNGD